MSAPGLASRPHEQFNGAKPEYLGSSQKWTRGPSLYSNLLPLVPSPPSFLSYWLTSIPLFHRQAVSPLKIKALYDELTRTIWISEEDDMNLLWRRGFFGKGLLSRSEPSWKRRIENTLDSLDGKEKRLTSEEITALRRVERKSTKQSKKIEKEAERLAIAAAANRASSLPHSSASLEVAAVENSETSAAAVPVEESPTQLRSASSSSPPTEGTSSTSKLQGDATEDVPTMWHLTAEHTQLQAEEAFFLLFAIGCLSLRVTSSMTDWVSEEPNKLYSSAQSAPLSILKTWELFLRTEATAPITPSIATPSAPMSLDPRLSRFDSPFLISYASYHHFRSMGWVVRSGVKFCCDWVLYGQAGPVGGHAEFAVVVIPNYADPEDKKSCPFRSTGSSLAEGEARDSWRWFHTINRVTSGVKKTLILLQVLIPPLSSLPHANYIVENPAQTLAMFEMREVSVRRWLAGRMRD